MAGNRFSLLLASALAVSFGTINPAGAVEVRVSGLPNSVQEDPASIAGRRVIERFQELNPDVRLVPAEGIRLPNVVDEATTIMMIAGGISPDVLELNFRSMDTFVSQGLVSPLDGFVQAADAAGRGVSERILPQVLPVVRRLGPGGEEHLFGIPANFMVMGLFFNKDVFRRAGLPLRAPADWVELREFARKIKALGNGYEGLWMTSGANASWNLISFIWSAGGDAVKEVGPNDWRAVFDDPGSVEAFRFYYQMVDVDRTVIRAASLPGEQRAKVGMFFGYVGGTMDNPRNVGFGTVPRGPHGGRGSEINAKIYALSSSVTDPRVREAAWRYIEFMSGAEAERVRTEALVEMGEAIRVNPRLLREAGYTQFLALLPEGFEDDFERALREGRPEPYGRNCNLIYQEMSYPLDRILLSKEIRADWLRGDDTAVTGRIQKILTEAVANTNERMIGFVPPEVMKSRRFVALLVVAGIVLTFALVCRRVFRIFAEAAEKASRPVSGAGWTPWLCLFPALALIFLWNYVPLARGTVMAFQDYRLVMDSAFVGLDNFASVLFDRSFWNSMLATLHFAAYALTLGFFTPILLAYALHIIPKHKVVYRTLYYLPAVISGTAVFFLWSALFGTDGPLNLALRFFGFEAQRAWTQDPYLAMLSCVIPGIWAGAGPGCLIYLAALKTIPEEQFEAAEIDGAGFFQKTWNVVYPALKALIFINFVGTVAAAFHGASNILIMTGGGPNGLTEVMSLKIFFEAFTRLRFGPATAMAWILGSMLVGLTVIQLQRLSKMEFKSAR